MCSPRINSSQPSLSTDWGKRGNAKWLLGTIEILPTPSPDDSPLVSLPLKEFNGLRSYSHVPQMHIIRLQDNTTRTTPPYLALDDSIPCPPRTKSFTLRDDSALTRTQAFVKVKMKCTPPRNLKKSIYTGPRARYDDGNEQSSGAQLRFTSTLAPIHTSRADSELRLVNHV